MENAIVQIRFLKIIVFILAILTITSFLISLHLLLRQNNFKTITAERLNIVEPNGQLKMVISNASRQHPGMINNKNLPARERPAGMIFFNDEGDECGGLIYDGNKTSASMTYSVDQFKNDQIMQWQYQQDKVNGKMTRSYGLKFWDRNDAFNLPKLLSYTDSLEQLHDSTAYRIGIETLKASGMLERERLFVGKNKDGEVGVFLRDANGKPRIKIYINSHNDPVIETLNDEGKPIQAK